MLFMIQIIYPSYVYFRLYSVEKISRTYHYPYGQHWLCHLSTKEADYSSVSLPHGEEH